MRKEVAEERHGAGSEQVPGTRLMLVRGAEQIIGRRDKASGGSHCGPGWWNGHPAEDNPLVCADSLISPGWMPRKVLHTLTSAGILQYSKSA